MAGWVVIVQESLDVKYCLQYFDASRPTFTKHQCSVDMMLFRVSWTALSLFSNAFPRLRNLTGHSGLAWQVYCGAQMHSMHSMYWPYQTDPCVLVDCPTHLTIICMLLCLYLSVVFQEFSKFWRYHMKYKIGKSCVRNSDEDAQNVQKNCMHCNHQIPHIALSYISNWMPWSCKWRKIHGIFIKLKLHLFSFSMLIQIV